MEGKPGREGSPISAASEGRRPFPAPPRPWVRCSPVAGMLPKGARAVCGHPPLRCTHPCAGQHAHPPGGDPPVCDTPTRVGTRVRRGGATRVCGHARGGTRRGRGHTRVHRRTQTPGSHPSFANAAPQGAPRPFPGSGSRGGSPIPGTHSPASSLPKLVGFVAPFPHSTQPTQLRAAAGAGLQEAVAEGPPPASFPAQGERTEKKVETQK